jgi:hypothetical protein
MHLYNAAVAGVAYKLKGLIGTAFGIMRVASTGKVKTEVRLKKEFPCACAK